MSELKVNSIKGVGASTAAITVNNTDGTCTANITNNLSNRNLIINGAMQVAQRGTSFTLQTAFAADRFKVQSGGVDEVVTASQLSLSTSTSPTGDLFRTAARITNGNQTSGAQAGSYVQMSYQVEAQDMANSGWEYASSSSFVTLSFYVRSSVAQTFYGWVNTVDGTGQRWTFDIPVTQADTWTRITKTISGNSNLTFDNDNGSGLQILFVPYYGTSYTNNKTLNSWAANDGTNYSPDMTTTWITTNDATFDITGVQLEVSNHATDFEHRSFGEELDLCQRYYQKFVDAATGGNYIGIGSNYSTSQSYMFIRFLKEMRTAPTIDQTNISQSFVVYDSANQSGILFAQFSGFTGENTRGTGLYKTGLSTTAGLASIFQVVNGTGAFLAASAEL